MYSLSSFMWYSENQYPGTLNGSSALKAFTEPSLSLDLTDCAWFSEDGSYLECKVLFSVYNFRYSVVMNLILLVLFIKCSYNSVANLKVDTNDLEPIIPSLS